MALLMAEEIHKRNLESKIKVKKIILGAERHSNAMRARIKELMGVEHVFDIYGLTELYGPGTGLDCSHHQGIHYWADHFIFEVLDPVTLKSVPHGEQGELVITTLSKEGSPLLRYRTHDITRILNRTCPCTTPFPMHDRILGRTDDMFTYRAVNIYPSQVDHVLSNIKGIGSEFQIHLKKRESGRDMMTIKVERTTKGDKTDDVYLAERVATEIRRKILVRSQIEIVEHGTLPRTQRKSQRVFDNRNGDAT
jgi:phenylacetate-CoA ligase